MTTIKDLFKDDFTKSSFKLTTDQEPNEYQIIGKYCIISLEVNSNSPSGYVLDAWIVNPDLTDSNPLGTGKRNNIVAALKQAGITSEFTMLDGEAFCKTDNFDAIRQCRITLGLKKRKRVTEEQKAAFRARIHA